MSDAARQAMRLTVSPRRVYAVVAVCAIVVYAGALWNRWAFDDLLYIVNNDLVHSASGWWRAFLRPYLPAEFGGYLYRPLTIATYAADWHIDGPVWFHAVNVAWHAGAAVLVAALMHRWAGLQAALVAGVLFAVHPVHVEAVANVVGRAELMAAVFTLLAVYAAVEHRSIGWSALSWLLGLCSKESAAVAPLLVLGAWWLGINRPPVRTMALFVGACVVTAGVYALARTLVLRPFGDVVILAPVFVGETWVRARMTAVAAIADAARLLIFPATLRADYSPNERTIVASPFDPRFALGVACIAVWAALLAVALRRQRRSEALGLIWIAVAYAPVANLLIPVGILIAERTLYLPSAGLALCVGALSRGLRPRTAVAVAAVLAVVGGMRTAFRVPVWRSDLTATLSVLEDSPRSYTGPMIMAARYLQQHRDSSALAAARIAAGIFPREARPYLIGAHAALALGQEQVADSLLARADRFCNPCQGFYRAEATLAERLGNRAAAQHLLAHAERRSAQ